MKNYSETWQVMTSLELDDPTPATDIAGKWVDVRGFRRASFHFDWASGSTPVGVLRLEGTNHADLTGPVSLSPTADLTGNSGVGYIRVPEDEMCYFWLRPVYAYTSGSNAILNCWLHLET